MSNIACDISYKYYLVISQNNFYKMRNLRYKPAHSKCVLVKYLQLILELNYKFEENLLGGLSFFKLSLIFLPAVLENARLSILTNFQHANFYFRVPIIVCQA